MQLQKAGSQQYVILVQMCYFGLNYNWDWGIGYLCSKYILINYTLLWLQHAYNICSFNINTIIMQINMIEESIPYPR